MISKQNQHILQLLDETTSDPVCITIAGSLFCPLFGWEAGHSFPFILLLLIMGGAVQSYVVVGPSTNTGKVMICEPVQINSFVQSRRTR